MKYVDVHNHIFPHEIAAKVVKALEDYYGYHWEGSAEVDDLIAGCRAAGVGRCVVFSSATKPEQVPHINDYISKVCSEHPDLFIGFGTLHPDYPDVAAEAYRIRQLGLRGIKFHPDFQRFAIDDPAALPMYAAAKDDLVMLFHVGDAHSDLSSPRRLAHVLELFPQAKIIGAHLGGYMCWPDAEKYLVGKNLYLDVSSTLMTGKISVAEVRKMVLAHGVDKVLFASDYPAVHQSQAIDDVRALGLSLEDEEKIFHLNAEKLLKLAD